MTAYIIKSSISLILLFGLYWFLLRKEKLFVFNRFFLIFSLVFSLIVPFISIPVNLPDNEAGDNLVTAINSTVPVFSQEQDLINYVDSQSINTTDYESVAFYERINFPMLLLFLYFTGVILLFIRFLRNIFFITRQIRSSERITYSGQRLVLADNQVNPFCFLNTIFVSKQAYLNNQIAGELLNHELEHARQAHSVDVIFIELIQIVYWFNPIIILYNKAVRVNHEYLADNGVIQDSPDIMTYADKLINFVTCNRNVPLTSGFNPSLTRKRLIMLTKSRSGVINHSVRIFITVNLAVALFLILSFTPSYSQQSELALDSLQLTENQSLKVIDIDRNEYKTVKIGSNIWMAENLKTTKYNDGTDIPLVREDKDWQKYEAGYSWYNNDEADNKKTYGALYNWYAVNTNKLCPTGWHVPTHAEYSYLLDPSFRDSIGGNLKETGNLHWKAPNTGATNQTGFTALPGGYRGLSGNFNFKEEQGIWWTSTSSNEFVGVSWFLRNDDSRFSPYWTSKRDGFSVRCIMDYSNESPAIPDAGKIQKSVKGFVVSYFGKYLPGVIISVKNKYSGVITDEMGRFSFSGIDENDSLVITYEGFKTQILKPVFTSEMVVRLNPDRDFKGPKTTDSDTSQMPKPRPFLVIDGVMEEGILMNEIDTKKVSTMTVLKGKEATDKYGEKGKNGIIEITSIGKTPGQVENKPAAPETAVNKKLIVVDGVIYNGELNDIPMQSIDVLSVISSFQATQKYGDIGKNGAVVIKTKQSALVSAEKHQFPLEDTMDKALKIVDGVEYFGKINDIPEHEIQTMSILKDKSATAVFGEKGKNGVVVITTKKSEQKEPVKIPQGLVSEYQDILNRHKQILQDGKEQYNLNLNEQEKSRLEQIFFQMTKDQQSQQMFVFIPDSSMVLKRSVPSKEQMQAFLDPKMYGVWINNYKVKNEELNNYTNTDFAHLTSSKLEKNAINFGNHVYQVNLMTNDYYQKYLTKKKSEKGNTLMPRVLASDYRK